MSWGRIKTILIILFLFTDIFLAFSIYTANKKETNVSPEIIDSAVQILKEHNISIQKSIISSKITSAPILQANNAIEGYGDFASLILGSDDYSEESDTFTTKYAKVSFSGDKFVYEQFIYPVENDFTSSEAQKTAFSRLKDLGFDLSGAKVVSSSEENGVFNIKIRDFYDDMPIFSSETDVVISAGTVSRISGSWFNRTGSGQYNSLKNSASVLVDFASSYSGSPSNITALNFGYNVFDSETYHKSASIIPVAKITLDDEAEYLIDARTSE